MNRTRVWLAAMVVVTLAACGSGGGDGGGDGGGGGSELGIISGQITFNTGGGFSSTEVLDSWTAAEFVPGELIVGFSDSATLAAQSSTLETAGLSVQFVRTLASPVTGAPALYSNGSLSDSELLRLADELASRPGVEYAHPNYLLQLQAVPNDPAYSDQWHYPRIKLEQAWDVTTGSENTVIAVVDSGILYSRTNPAERHPDFGPNILPGYDFVTSVQSANDGDGRDDDPFDPGDNIGGQGTYHGSHVAGTIAALSNDANYGAGVDWNARIVPVRVMGLGGSGNIADIYEGMLWAAGFNIEGVPPNQNPAHIINMSLGAKGACPPVIQQAIDAVVNQAGSILVVAAGNDTMDVAQVTPAGCQNVITVGATEYRDYRAEYSNYGTGIHIMAPGGDTLADLNGDGWPDGVLSAGRNDADRSFILTFKDGTSMAAPHVAGVIGLMLAVNPNLTAAQARQIIMDTAMPLPNGACQPNMCGAGLIDAHAAVLAAGGGGPGPGNPDPVDPGPTDPDPWNPEPVDPVPGGPGNGSPKGAMIVAAFQQKPDGQFEISGSQTSTTPLTGFSFQSRPGLSYVEAWSDENNNGQIDNGDYLGAHPFPVTLLSGANQSGVNIAMNLVTGVSGVNPEQAARLEALLGD